MGVRITRVLTLQERHDMDEAAMARGWYRNDRRVFLPGMAWYQHFYFDPTGEFERWRAAQPDPEKYCRQPMIKRSSNPDDRAGFLSPHYWRDWSDKRPPICVVCPNGEQWEIDRWSSNGTGWTVTGELPHITCSPSIVVVGYHGFLRDGEFSADLDGRGPVGIVRTP
jgi:hypothetical protein